MRNRYTVENYKGMIIFGLLLIPVTLFAIYELATGYVDSSTLGAVIGGWIIWVFSSGIPLYNLKKEMDYYRKQDALREEAKDNFFKYFNEEKFAQYLIEGGADHVSKRSKTDHSKYPYFENERFTMRNGKYTTPFDKSYDMSVFKIENMLYHIGFKEPHDNDFFDAMTKKYRGIIKFNYINRTLITAYPNTDKFSNDSIEETRKVVS